MRRCFAIDVLLCDCGGRREVIALIKAGDTNRKILSHLGMATELPTFKQPRGPPGHAADATDDDLETHYVQEEWWPDDIDEA